MQSTILQLVLVVLLLDTALVIAQDTRVYTNPLNGKAVDIFLVVDESANFLNSVIHRHLTSILGDVAVYFNPSGSLPYFGVYFYGATTSVNNLIPFTLISGASVKAALNAK